MAYVVTATTAVGQITEQDSMAEDMDNRYFPCSGRYQLRNRRKPNYGHLHHMSHDKSMRSTDGFYAARHMLFTQHHVGKGLRLFGSRGETAVIKELSQLHMRDVLEPQRSEELTPSEKAAALAYLMFLKEKKTGEIKGRGCADGRKQREYMSKEENSAPTVSIESVVLSCVIDAMEKRDVCFIDIPGAFMQAEMNDTVHVKMEGSLAELMVKIDPKLYRKYLSNENGHSVLYGTLQAAILFWRTLTAKLVAMGFQINPYERCVANKLIDGNQCTILWHVDDLKVSQ